MSDAYTVPSFNFKRMRVIVRQPARQPVRTHERTPRRPLRFYRLSAVGQPTGEKLVATEAGGVSGFKPDFDRSELVCGCQVSPGTCVLWVERAPL